LIRQDKLSTFYEYDSLGRLFKTITSESVEVKIYDFLDRVVEERTEDLQGVVFAKTVYEYDINGNCSNEKTFSDLTHYSETKTVFNSENQPVLILDALGNETKITYHYTDHLEKNRIDALGRKKIELYDRLGQLVAIHQIGRDGKLLSLSAFAYDGRGNKTLQNDRNFFEDKELDTHEIRTTYDGFSQKLDETEQNEKTTAYTYQNDKLYQITKPDGVILTHAYDLSGRLKELSSSDGTIHYRYFYDLNDNLIKVDDLIQDMTIERVFDALNRLIKEKQVTEKQVSGFEINYTYDALNRIKEVQFRDEKIIYSYSPTTLTSASRYKNEQLLYTFSQESDLRGKSINQILPGNLNIVHHWNDLGRCVEIISTPFQQSFIYDKVGNLTSTLVEDGIGVYESHFSYNDLDQIIEEKGLFNHHYSFDSLNNRRCKNGSDYSVNGLNQVTAEANVSYSYDKNGNRISKDEETYFYDALNRLTAMSINGTTVNYKYDAFGRRIERTANNETIQYIYQFDTEIGALKNGEIIEFKAIYKPFAAFAIELNSSIYAPIRNHRGDICLLVDMEGNIASSYRYDAFGQFHFEGTVASPWLFSSGRYDEAIKTYRFLNRDYDFNLGRWLTADPLGFADGPNLYAYVHNNPLMYVDPYGLFEEGVDKPEKKAPPSFWQSPRFQGICQMFTGSAEMGAGGAIAYGSFGGAAPLGFSVAAHGADQFCTGLRQAWTNSRIDTATSQLLQKTGMSAENANFADNCISVAGTAGAAAYSRSCQLAASRFSVPPPTAAITPTLRPATSVISRDLLKNKLISQEIAGGHAFEKHILNQGEFCRWIRTKKQLAQHIEMVLNKPTAVKELVRNRTAYWHQETGTIIIRTPSALDGGTVFQPTMGYEYFLKKIR